MRLCSKGMSCLLAAVVLLVLAPAVADISEIVFRVDADRLIDPDHPEQGSYVGFFEVASDQLVYDENAGSWKLDIDDPVDMMDGGNLVGTLAEAHLILVDRPFDGLKIDMRFTTRAGVTETTFRIDSAVLSFDTIPSADAAAKATATIRVTDASYDGSAVTTGLGPPGHGIYIALYNDTAEFADLVWRVSVQGGAGSSSSGTGSRPSFGFESIAADVYNVRAEADFTLSAEDTVEGTTKYTLDAVPVPLILGDLNCDGDADSFDIDPFMLALTDVDGYNGSYPNCHLMAADCNEDGFVNNFDIDSFVQLVIGFPVGDLNCDGNVNNFDIDPFVLALTDEAAYNSTYPDCDHMLADINGDGSVNNFDIDPFVNSLTSN